MFLQNTSFDLFGFSAK